MMTMRLMNMHDFLCEWIIYSCFLSFHAVLFRSLWDHFIVLVEDPSEHSLSISSPSSCLEKSTRWKIIAMKVGAGFKVAGFRFKCVHDHYQRNDPYRFYSCH